MKRSTLYRNPKIEVRKSRLHGFGVFANKNIKEGEVLEEAPVLHIKSRHVNGNLGDYVYYNDYKCSNKGYALVFGTGSVYNHGNNDNAKWYINNTRKTFKYVALKNIKKDEEILISYGEDYWSTRNIKLKTKK